METNPTEAITKVIEVVEINDYSEILADILGSLENVEYALQILSGFGLFAVIVCLLYFCYKFLRIFF